MLTGNKLEMLNSTKELFDELSVIYEEKANGHLRVDGCDYWATTSKWYDPKTGKKGVGLNSFIIHMGIDPKASKNNKADFSELQSMVTKLQDWLHENHTPHTKVIVDSMSVEVLASETCLRRKY